ncbi:MAG: hypothetical protein ABIA93_03960, partial [Candidatus Woesearchaeota archaeon]
QHFVYQYKIGTRLIYPEKLPDSMLQHIFDDIRGTLVFIFVLIIFGAVFGAIHDSIPQQDTQTREAVENVGNSGLNALMILFIGMGILGTIGLIVILVSFFKT